MTPADLLPEVAIPVGLLLSAAVLAAALALSLALVRQSVRANTAAHARKGGHYVHIEAPPEVDPKSAVLAWRQLASISHGRWRRWWHGQAHLVWEYHFTGGRLAVRIWVPGTLPTDQIIHAVDAGWPGAVCTVTDAQAPLPAGDGTHLQSGWFALAKRHVASAVPLVAATDTGEVLRGLIAAGVSHRGDDIALVQITARPAAPAQVRRAAKTAAGPRTRTSLLGGLLDLVTPGAGHRPTPVHRPVEPAWITAHRKQVADRLADGALWSIGVRYAVATTVGKPYTVARARNLAAATAPILGGAWRRRRGGTGLVRALNTWAAPAPGVLASAAEVTALAHVPADAIVPALARAGARPVAPAPEVPSGGRGTKTLGVAATSGKRVALSAQDARYHLHLAGATGVGKSTLMVNLILADIRDRRSVVVLDPHGDLIRDVLDRLDPDQTRGRVVIIDPTRPEAPPGLAPVRRAPDSEIAIDHLVGIFRQLWPDHWGPRADDIAKQALRTQAQLQQKDLAGLSALPLILSDRVRRAPLVTSIQDDEVLQEFWRWFDALPESVQTVASGPVLARLRSVLSRKFIRQVIGDPADELCIDLPAALDNAGIILVNLPKGVLGDDAARLLGSLIAAGVWQAVLPRQALPARARRDCTLYMDEGHNYLLFSNMLADVLAEARKLGLSFTFAHQHLGQLPRDLADALDANARTKILFASSPRDAKLFAAHTLPNLTDHDLVHMGAYTAACRTIVAGQIQPAFTLKTLPLPEALGHAETIRALADSDRPFTTWRHTWPRPTTASTSTPSSPSLPG
ncbi:type IV secretory system conjugative DNA transfer family protein [Glycomyces sp. MUSA5-2]|uniref:type IV secretory system conjugative DNA transfer family protein n=1 Tax=Glycomyces sp. MUSA5-2 TaxID=2053002 RepID=UPI003007F4C3